MVDRNRYSPFSADSSLNIAVYIKYEGLFLAEGRRIFKHIGRLKGIALEFYLNLALFPCLSNYLMTISKQSLKKDVEF